VVPTVRLELTRLSPPPPQDGVSTNSTTSANGADSTAKCHPLRSAMMVRKSVARDARASREHWTCAGARPFYLGISADLSEAGAAGVFVSGAMVEFVSVGICCDAEGAPVTLPPPAGAGGTVLISPPRGVRNAVAE